MGDYKELEEFEDYVLIKHYITGDYMIMQDDYKEVVNNNTNSNKLYNPSTMYQKCKSNIINGYKLAEQLNYCEIINEEDDFIQIKMKKYEMLLDNISYYKGTELCSEKLCSLLEEMYLNNIVHCDFAPRNIGIDEFGNFRFIDLNEVISCEGEIDFIDWIAYCLKDFKFEGLGTEFCSASDMFCRKFFN